MAKPTDLSPRFLTLADASARLATNTGQAVTPDWLLNLAADGRIQMHFIVRHLFETQPRNVAEVSVYLPGEYVPLEASWSKSMLGSVTKPRSIIVQTLPHASGAMWIQDGQDANKRLRLTILETDLFILATELDALHQGSMLESDSATGLDDQKLGSSAIKTNYPGLPNPINWRKAFENRDNNGLDQCLVTPGKKGNRTCWKSKLEKWLIEKGHYPKDHFAVAAQMPTQAQRPATTMAARKVQPMKSNTPVKSGSWLDVAKPKK